MALDTIQIDSRLPAALQRFDFNGATVLREQLPAGDFWLLCDDGALLVVDHQSPDDLLQALRRDRLFGRLRAMRDYSDWCYLVLDGELRAGANDKLWLGSAGAAVSDQGFEGRETGWTFSAVEGALASLQECGLVLVHCNGLLDLEPTLLRLANRDRNTKRAAPARELDWLDAREAFLAGLPGIGPEQAQALLAACGELSDCLAALTDNGPDTCVAGIGPQTRAHTRQFLGVPDGRVLAPWVQYADEPEPIGASA